MVRQEAMCVMYCLLANPSRQFIVHMKVKLSEVVGSVEALKNILALKLPIKVSYRISKLVSNQVEGELKEYNEQRNKLVKEFGTENEDGSTSVKEDRLKEFSEELQKLLDVDVKFDFEPIKLEEIENVDIAPKDLITWIFAE